MQTYRFLRSLPAWTLVLAAITFSAPVARPALAAQPAHAVDSAVRTQTIIFQPTQDTTIAEASGDINFGSDPTLTTANEIGQQALLQFDLGQIPAGAVVTKATLTLNMVDANPAPTEVDGFLIQGPWQADKVTYVTAPVIEGLVFTQTVGSAPLPSPVSFDATNAAAAWIGAPDRNFGVALRTSSRLAARVFESREGRVAPTLAVTFSLPPIRVCWFTADPCTNPAVGADVHSLVTGAAYLTDKTGLVLDDGAIQLGDRLWAKARWIDVVLHPKQRLFYTSGDPVDVVTSAFVPTGPNQQLELHLVLLPSHPLLLQDLDVSTQWVVQDDAAKTAWLRQNLIKASDFLYDFTEGQFALGNVIVHQYYDSWDGANFKLLASNTLRPNAAVGGIVNVETPDISPSISISYTPGSIFMGSYWNRFGTPPGQVNTQNGAVVPDAVTADDWALALAHELSHYILFLFDAYTDKNGHPDAAIADLCRGTAMSDAYQFQNHALIQDQAYWDKNCRETEAHFKLNGRTEWDTVQTWNRWSLIPAAPNLGGFPPAPVTQVSLLPPATPLPPPAASQVYTIAYQAGATSSGEARAFLLRGDERVLEQGKPLKNGATVQLIDARLGDRLCVYDINDFADPGEASQHQFGCRIIQNGDSILPMTLDQGWAPQVALTQSGANQLQLAVEQALPPGAVLQARLFPELVITPSAGATGYTTITLSPAGANTWQGQFNLSEPVPPVYLQLWVDETPAAPATRREIIADRGTGGNGAFGPAKLYGGVLVVSSDGGASYQPGGDIKLLTGQSIAWQSMPGTPALPSDRQIAEQAYRLDAFPPALVDHGTVSIQFSDVFGAGASGARVNAASSQAGAGPAVYFWDGSQWTALDTTISTPIAGPETGVRDGMLLATAPSHGAGVYAVLGNWRGQSYLPVVTR